MTQKWVLVTGGVVLAVVVAVAIALGGSDGATKGSPSGEKNGTGSNGGSSANATSGPGGASSSTTGSAAPSKSTTSSASGASLPPLTPFPRLPESDLSPRQPDSVASKGAALAPLSAAPDDTISGLKVGAVPDGSRYRVRLQPYGIGPTSALGSRLVVAVDTVTPMGGAPKLSTIVNAILLVVVDTTHDGAMTKGGTYDATLQFRSDGTKLIPIMSAVKAVDS